MNVILFGKRVFVDVIRLGILRYHHPVLTGLVRNPMTSILKREIEKVHMKMEAEIGVTQPLARECLELPEAGGGEEGVYFKKILKICPYFLHKAISKII